jgi:hypothetical protein
MKTKMLGQVLFKQSSGSATTANKQFCAMLAGHRYNEQQIHSVQQSRLCTNSSKEQRLKH